MQFTFRFIYSLLAVAAIVCGLIWRLAPLGLPIFLLRYGGGFIWGGMLYFLLTATLPSSGIGRLFVLSISVAAGSECLRLYHTPALDAFRATLAGALILGRIFSLKNIIAYSSGIGCAALADMFFLRPFRQ